MYVISGDLTIPSAIFMMFLGETVGFISESRFSENSVLVDSLGFGFHKDSSAATLSLFLWQRTNGLSCSLAGFLQFTSTL